MKQYEYFDHTADVLFKAYGKTKEERFSNAALAFFNVIVDTKEVSPVVIKEVKVTGDDDCQLLYNFLEELIFLVNTDFFVLHQVKELTIEGGVLYAKLWGDTDISKYETRSDIKAVTYNDMEVTEEYVQCVLDI